MEKEETLDLRNDQERVLDLQKRYGIRYSYPEIIALTEATASRNLEEIQVGEMRIAFNIEGPDYEWINWREGIFRFDVMVREDRQVIGRYPFATRILEVGFATISPGNMLILRSQKHRLSSTLRAHKKPYEEYKRGEKYLRKLSAIVGQVELAGILFTSTVFGRDGIIWMPLVQEQIRNYQCSANAYAEYERGTFEHDAYIDMQEHLNMLMRVADFLSITRRFIDSSTIKMHDGGQLFGIPSAAFYDYLQERACH